MILESLLEIDALPQGFRGQPEPFVENRERA